MTGNSLPTLHQQQHIQFGILNLKHLCLYYCKSQSLNHYIDDQKHDHQAGKCSFSCLGHWSLTLRVVPTAVLWRENEGAGSGDRGHISLCEERYGGSSGDAEQRRGCVGSSVAGRQRCTRSVAEGAGGHADRLPQWILLWVTFGGNLLTSNTPCAQSVIWLLLCRRGAGGHPCCSSRCHSCTTAVWAGGHGPRRRQVHSNVPDVDG